MSSVPLRRAGVLCLLAACIVSFSGCGDAESQSESAAQLKQAAQRGDDDTLSLDHVALARAVARLERTYGPMGIAVDGHVHGTHTEDIAWSTFKVPIAIAADRAELANAAMIESAIAASDNDSAFALWLALGSDDSAIDAVEKVLAEGGDTVTSCENLAENGEPTPYGFTEWSLKDQLTFASHLRELEGAETTFEAMGESKDYQPYGLAMLRNAHFKGGWGPDDDGNYLVRQFGIFDGPDGQEVPIAVMVKPSDGLYETGQKALTRLVQELQRLLASS